MFNIKNETKRIVLLNHAKIHGLPRDNKPTEKRINGADKTCADRIEAEAEAEAEAISRGYKNRSRDFGLRLSKCKGENHH